MPRKRDTLKPVVPDILRADYDYFPFALPRLWSDSARNFCFDRPKLNLLWLLYPRVDTLHDKPWAGNHYTRSIDASLDATSRRYLQGPPQHFLEYWLDLTSRYELAIEQHWPAGYVKTMARRVDRVNARLRAGLPKQAVLVDFKRRVRVA
jgi:hypothetical protein